MSGIKQHYIPQFLLSGFASRIEGNTKYCYVFRILGKSYESNIRQTGCERYFYGSAEDTIVDDLITEQEQKKYQKVLKLLKGFDRPSALDHKSLDDLIIHLAMRTKYLRENLKAIGENTCKSAKESYQDEKFIEERRATIEEMVRDIINKNPSMVPFDDAMKNLTITNLNFEPIVKALELTQESMKATAKSSQLKFLKTPLSTQKRLDSISHLNWFVQIFPDNSLILSDAVVWCLNSNGFTPLAMSRKEISLVVFPISHSHVIIGTEEQTYPSNITALKINEISSSLSQEYFISSIRSEQHKSLSNRINTGIVKGFI